MQANLLVIICMKQELLLLLQNMQIGVKNNPDKTT